ncbi:MAG TPA: DPP IV N-terminal domain-containing protein [Gemmataceae bacterium]|nr:DPP IV N-terminal domain-containing protein [Gemmataceae bacterium]
MKNRSTSTWNAYLIIVCAILLGGLPRSASAQDRLQHMPGYEQYKKMSPAIRDSVKLGTLAVTWVEDGKAFEYQKDGKRYRYNVAAGKATELPGSTGTQGPGQRGGGRGRRFQQGGPARGRQFASALSPDGKLKVFYRDRNLWLSDPSGVVETPITTDGSEKTRTKYGIASWVYGEELFQRTAMWWSPDSGKIAYYAFNESRVPDYYLSLSQTKLHDTLDTEAYPLPGDPNPVVELFVFDVHKKNAVRVDVRDGKPFDNHVLGHYVYNVSWSQDGKELLFYRTNRRQNIMEFVAANPETGKCRVIVHEEWPSSWVENLPEMQFLKDGKRFIWSSERTGWKNYYLYDLTGKLLATLTGHPLDVSNIVRVDDKAKLLYYRAHSGDNPMKLQLHRVGLDGKGDNRLTDPAFNHTVNVAPDGAHFIDVAEAHDTPPTTRLLDAKGKVLAELATSDMTKFEKLGLKRVELLKYKAADGQTDLYGLLYRPSQFDPNKKYPLLVSVYAGPATNGARESFALPNALTEYGFLVASLDSRSAAGRGKRFLDAIYLKLGRTEIDDQAAGVKSLWNRPYVDKERVGMFGTSYGGTSSALSLLRYPDVFQAACASSAVTDFRNYDSIYTERYMWLPAENKEGYDAGSLMKYADKLKGRLMLFFGTADDNVHPSNTLQLIQALQKAGKSFDVQVGPDMGHSGLRQERMMEFFIEVLGTAKQRPQL